MKLEKFKPCIRIQISVYLTNLGPEPYKKNCGSATLLGDTQSRYRTVSDQIGESSVAEP